MSRPMRFLVVALIATPVITWVIYRIAKGLGYLDPPASKEQELRRTITMALYAFLIFLPTLFYGFEKGWPRVWRIFGAINGLALVFFAAVGTAAGVKLWRLRHPRIPSGQRTPALPPDSPLTEAELRSSPDRPDDSLL